MSILVLGHLLGVDDVEAGDYPVSNQIRVAVGVNTDLAGAEAVGRARQQVGVG